MSEFLVETYASRQTANAVAVQAQEVARARRDGERKVHGGPLPAGDGFSISAIRHRPALQPDNPEV